jgi:hypothetical protein
LFGKKPDKFVSALYFRIGRFRKDDTEYRRFGNSGSSSVFYKAKFIESWGRGILKIQKGFEDAGIKAPQFEEDCGGDRGGHWEIVE